MKKLMLVIIICIVSQVNLSAAKIDTVSTYSDAMKKEIKAIVITPDSYNAEKQLPVLYLLHGWSDNYSSWIKKAKGIEKLADLYSIIIVCPDGGYDSWYFDSEQGNICKYETYISKELVEYVDSNYKTISNRNGRAITGLSMGGHGALYISFKHQDVFGAAGSMSGGVDFRPFPNNWGIKDHIGSMSENKDIWDENSVINMVYLLNGNYLAIIVDCGTDDFFFDVNKALHEKLLYFNIPHDFISRPGKHNWDYWNNAIGYQALFFDKFFRNANRSN